MNVDILHGPVNILFARKESNVKTYESQMGHYVEWIVELTKKSPTGNIDSKSLSKLIEECKEFDEAYNDKSKDAYDLMLELADIVYYCVKLMIYCLYRVTERYSSGFSMASLSIVDLFKICTIKYDTRHVNGKSHELEREAIKEFY